MKKRIFYCILSIFVLICFLNASSSGIEINKEKNSSEFYTAVQENFDYILIINDDMQASLTDFKNWKESLGYNLKIETTSFISDNYEGVDLSEKIRNYLISNYIEWNVKYVLIVGSRNTIPMRVCIPFSEYSDDDFLQCPSDYYYADLTGDWDYDNDGFYGEYQDDKMDFYPEVIVGRIPCDDPDNLESIFQRIITYESDSSDWKKNVLLPGAVIFYKNMQASGYTWERSDGATLMEECRLDIFEPNDFICTRMYEEEGLKPSTYEYDIPLTRENVLSEWTKNYGIVDMLGHASNTKITRLVWTEDDGDNIPEYPGELDYTTFLEIRDSDDLTKELPPIVYTSGCAQFYSSYNMGRSFIEDGAAVAFIGTTQGSWYDENLKWDNENDGGTYSLNYYFFKNLIDNKQSCGNSLYSSKIYYYENFWYEGLDKNWIFRAYDNIYSLTLYGDPSLGLYERSNPPNKPDTPIGPDSGNIKTEYIYSTVSTDPDQDKVRYLFDWGDGTSSISDYYNSGEEASVSHKFDKKGDFQIRVRCEDINGEYSEWSDPLSVTMPKNKLLIKNSIIFSLLENFPFLYKFFIRDI